VTRLGDDISALVHGKGEHVAGAETLLPGADVSSFQGTPADWRAQAGAIEWAAVKFTELQPGGTLYLNPDAAADWAWLKANGKGRVAYCFGHPGTSPDATAAALTSQLREHGCDDGDGIALDLEVTDGRSAALTDGWALTVLSLLRRDWDREPLLYSYLSFIDAGNCASLGKFPLWISDPSSAPGHPRVPRPWKTFAIHQTAITGPVDRDLARYPGLAAMRAALGRQEAPVRVRVSEYTSDGTKTLREVAAAHDAVPSELLRLTAIAGGRFAPDLAKWVNEVMDCSVSPLAPLPEGIVLRVPA